MSKLIAQFERDCAAHGLRPVDVVRASGVDVSLWWKWKREGTEVRKGEVKPRAISPTLRNFEAILDALDRLVAEKKRSARSKPAKPSSPSKQEAA